MYINDVIRLAKNAYPSEYDEWEMYVWCNEVSAMLTVEDRCFYSEAYLSSDKNGAVLLPEYVGIENIYSVYCRGRELEKQDLRIKNRNMYCGAVSDIIKVVFTEPYIPIRIIRYRGEAVVSGNTISVNKCEFVKGDTIDIVFLNGDGTAEIEIKSVAVTDTQYIENEKYLLTAAEGSLNEADGKNGEAVITRVICEKTICNAPFDGMYVNYILAKINLYQHNTESYNHYMTAFNSMLSAYKKWLINHMPSERSVFYNWW